jgi:Flp pilus assembly protein TadD
VRYHAVLLVVAGALAYAGSLSNPFLYDDQTAIVNNPTIRALSPRPAVLSPPRDTPVAGRPLVNLSLALNYSSSGLDVTGYHLTNVALHLLVALTLFAIIRRTWAGGAPRDADGFAFACALVWVLHPLNSEVVDYVVQRTESLMALCYLATLYCAIRASAGPDRWGWRLAAVLACAAGMASKESMVTAPLMVAIYDRVFLYPSWREAARARTPLYAGLAATWLLLAALMWDQPRTSVGIGTGVSPWVYFLNQLPIIGRYLFLAVWPRPLVVDYGLPRPTLPPLDLIVPGVLLVALAVATLVALRRRPAVGFLGLWFFVTLAPTSSVVPIATEVGAERRMYLPLMALVVLAVLGVRWLLRTALRARGAGGAPAGATASAVVLAVVCVLLAAGTVVRTREYHSVRSIAQSDVDRYPHGRARLALARELVAANEHTAALRQLEVAVSDYPPAHLGLATEMATSGRLADAASEAREFIRLAPDSPEVPTARDLMGRALALQGQYDAAVEQFILLARARPNDPAPLVSTGDARLRQRRVTDAIASYEAALRLRPGDPDILTQLGLAFGAAGRMGDASGAFGGAAAARPTDVRILNLLGRSLAAEGRFQEAVAPMRRVVELARSDRQAADNLAVMQRLAEAQRGRRSLVENAPQTGDGAFP